MATEDIVVGQEIRIRSRKTFDAFGRLLVFEGTATAVTDSTVDADVRFNGGVFSIVGIPREIVAAVMEGSGG